MNQKNSILFSLIVCFNAYALSQEANQFYSFDEGTDVVYEDRCYFQGTDGMLYILKNPQGPLESNPPQYKYTELLKYNPSNNSLTKLSSNTEMPIKSSMTPAKKIKMDVLQKAHQKLSPTSSTNMTGAVTAGIVGITWLAATIKQIMNTIKINKKMAQQSDAENKKMLISERNKTYLKLAGASTTTLISAIIAYTLLVKK
jgi:hypothetical protein